MILGSWKYKRRNNDIWYWAYESTKQETMINDMYLTKITLDETEEQLAYEMGSTISPVFGLELLISKMTLRTI